MISYSYVATVESANYMSAVIYEKPSQASRGYAKRVGSVRYQRKTYRKWYQFFYRWPTTLEFADGFHKAVVEEMTRIQHDRARAEALKRHVHEGEHLEAPPVRPRPRRSGTVDPW